jgi:hypothetical protein
LLIHHVAHWAINLPGILNSPAAPSLLRKLTISQGSVYTKPDNFTYKKTDWLYLIMRAKREKVQPEGTG